WAPQRMASRTRSAGDNFLSMRAMRRGEKFNLVSAAVCGLSAVVAPCLIRAFLYSRNAWRLCVIFWRMHRLQYRLRPSLRARHMPNSDNGSDSSHLGHLFNSTTLNSAVLVTPCAPLLRFRHENFRSQTDKPPAPLVHSHPLCLNLAMNPDVSRK